MVIYSRVLCTDEKVVLDVCIVLQLAMMSQVHKNKLFSINQFATKLDMEIEPKPN